MFPTSRLRLKMDRALNVHLGFVKRVRNNVLLFPGSRRFGAAAKSLAVPVFKTAAKAFGVAAVINHVKELISPSERFPGARVQRTAFLAADLAGLLFPPFRLLPVSARAVDLITEQPVVGQLYGIQGR
jgi:hypothetical protein